MRARGVGHLASAAVKRLAAALLAAGLLAACGSETESTPSACLASPEELLAALEAAPGPVLLDGTTPISDCLIDGQPAGDLNNVGQAAITAATKLNAEAVRDPSGEEATQLGYLVGALEEGASETGGIHADLIRRVNTAARFSQGGGELGAEFERTFGAGYAAAREDG